MGQLLGTETFFDYFEAFGFTQKTGIDLPGESQSIYHDRDMSLMDLAVESFGQNFSITPIQMITACAAIANGGYLVQPHVVSQIVDNDGNMVTLPVTELPVKQVLQKKLVPMVKLVVIINTLHLTAVLLLPMTRNMRYWYSLMNQRETVTTAALLQALCLLKLWRKFFHT